MNYILISTGGLSIFYLLYLVIYRKENNHRYKRYFLLGSVILSLIIPLNLPDIHIETGVHPAIIPLNSHVAERSSHLTGSTEEGIKGDHQGLNVQSLSGTTGHKRKKIIETMYILIAGILIARMIAQIIMITTIYISSEKKPFDGFVIVRNNRFKQPFSFFSWIFIPADYVLGKEPDPIIAHEKIHTSQVHTLDLILIDVVASFMWFNPVVWLVRKSIQLNHEYLADEGALGTGIDRLRYQALLINQIAEERLISLSSSFNHSLTKKRMTMMNKTNKHSGKRRKILVLIPLSILLALGVACVDRKEKKDISTNEKPTGLTAVEPVGMNILYIGVDNPVNIASSGYPSSDLEVSIDNGQIEGNDGRYTVRPAKPGTALIKVFSNGQEIDQREFRVLTVPDPVAEVGGKHGGTVDKAFLPDHDEVLVNLKNFNFDIKFKVISFTLSVPVGQKIIYETSNADHFTDRQKALLKNLQPGQQVILDDIKCMGPDGSIRNLGAIVFKID